MVSKDLQLTSKKKNVLQKAGKGIKPHDWDRGMGSSFDFSGPGRWNAGGQKLAGEELFVIGSGSENGYAKWLHTQKTGENHGDFMSWSGTSSFDPMCYTVITSIFLVNIGGDIGPIPMEILK